MDTGDWIALVAVVIAVASGVVAIRSNALARQANREAEKANGIASSALEVQRASLPPVRSQADQLNDLVRFTNTSSRNVYVTAVEPRPDNLAGLMHLRAELPTRVEYGDAFEMLSVRTLAGSIDLVTLRYYFEDDSERVEQRTERRL